MEKKLWSTARLQCLIDCSFDERTPTRLLVTLAWLRWLIEFRPMWDTDEAPVGCIRINGEWPPAVKAALDREITGLLSKNGVR